MFRKIILSHILFLNIIPGYCQDDSLQGMTMPAVIIKAFEQNRRLMDVPGGVNYTGNATFVRFANTSIVNAVNAMPGVRMEERSPGSYRMNIRGSSLRSPFGVRNVKIYFNDIPFTDPGGHSYFNQLGYYNFNSIEIIKGANNSMYGAGTGGVMLVESLDENEKAGLQAEYTTGSFGLQNMYGSIISTSEKLTSKIGYQHQESDGYREHSKSRRDVFAWNGSFRIKENRFLKTTFLYGDLFYETPGALTKTEFDKDPKAARPANGAIPGAVAANASIRQRMFIAGASYIQPITSNIQNKSILYGMFSELRNPAISGYGRNSEPHAGGRTVFKLSILMNKLMVVMNTGAEIQQGFSSFSTHKNVGGNQDSLRSNDEVNNRQLLLFTQTSLEWKTLSVNLGASWNNLKIGFQRFNPATAGRQSRSFNNEIAPRVTIMKKFENINIYAGVARGFSPPTTAELVPTGGAINLGLNAEEGINYDIGMKAQFFDRLYVDVNAFSFALKNTIVLRRTVAGGDFYINAGSTEQYGVESFVNYPFVISPQLFKKGALWFSHTWHNFHYKDFKQATNDFSGNRLPSVAPHIISTGADIAMKNGLLATVTYYFADKIALNDANSVYSPAFHLLGAKIGYENAVKNKLNIKLIFGIENILNQVYSLGNDINGFGGRYYNAAPGRNYYAGVSFRFLTKRNLVE